MGNKINRLLERQLRRHFGDLEQIPSDLAPLFEVIGQTYDHHDQDRILVERSLELSSDELNAANSEMRAIFKLFPDIFFRLDNSGLILDYSTGNTGLLFSEHEDLTGKYIQNIPQEDVGAAFRAAIKLTNSTHKKEVFEYNMILQNEINYYEATLIPIFENQIIVFIKDISERKTGEKELKLAKEKAEEADKLKSAFLANLSHEIRTPMNSILGFTEFLDDDDIRKEDKQHFIDIIRSSGHHLLALINDIIDISKIEAGQLSLHLDECNVNQMMYDLNKLFLTKQKIANNQLELRVRNTLRDAQSIIITDSVRLKQILINLLSNAIKFTHKGFIEFGYKLIREEGQQEMMEFFVKDTGTGISEENLEMVFNRFSQEKNNASVFTEGTGLGLSISKELVHLLGGDIRINSKLGKGTEFLFTIPYTVKKRSLIQDKELETNHHNTKDLSGKNILIVEDQRNNSIFIEVLLKAKNVNIINATNGQQAIDICKQNKDIDLVLMDLKMPIMNGLTATKQIKAFRHQLPIIAQTALAMDGDRERALAAGCDDYISKPINTTELIQKILMHL